jgi:DNA primase
MTIPPRFLDELRARITLSDVIRKHVRLTRAGREFKGCCPFHNEKTPSFYVNDDKQFYHCFGCGAHGSVIDYVMRHDNLSFPETIEALAQQVGMQVPKSAPEDIEKAKKEKSLYTLMDEAAKWLETQLRNPASKVPYDYIRERGVPEDVLHAFRVGYAPSDMQAMRKHLLGLGYTDTQMIECGIVKTSEKAREPYAFFRERVMFPVPDRRGRIVAFGGRILPDHLRSPDRGDFKPPKYINSIDTPLFHKGKMLYGEPHARMAATEGKPVIVVEGYLDVIACFRANFRGAVAPLGTALTEDQILILWKMIPSESKIPILCFDGDNAGRRAASRACERILPLLKPDHSAKIAFLPEGEDPDSLIKAKGEAGFQAVLDGAMNLVDFLYLDNTEGRVLETPEERAGLSKALEETASRIGDRTVQHYYREAFREKIKKAFAPAQQQSGAPSRQNAWAAQRQPFTQGRFGKPPQPAPITQLRRPAFAKNSLYSKALLACIINNPEIFHDVEEDLGRLDLPENALDRLRQAVLSTLGRDPALDGAGLKTHLSERGFEGELAHLLSDSIYTHASFSRPSNDPGAVLSAWRTAWKAMQMQGAQGDLEQAILAMKENPSEENERRLNALRENRKTSDG